MQKAIKVFDINNENNFKKFIRQFSSLAIIQKIYDFSKAIYAKGCSKENLTKYCSLINQNIIIQPWQFADLIYQSIKYSNDYRGIQQIDDDLMCLILLKTNDYIKLKANEIMSKTDDSFDMQLFIYGFACEQFKYQDERLFYNNIIRELYILFTISKKYFSNKYYEKNVFEEVGVEWKQLIEVLYGIFVNSFFNPVIVDVIDNISLVNEEVYNKVINYYSVDYEKIRNSNLERQIFYSKPYIKTQKGEIITASVYFNKFIVEHAVFWVIRNYYLKNEKAKRQSFTNDFGILYEKYFEEICAKYNVHREKIPEKNDSKRADWKLLIGNNIFLIEQKTSIMSLSIKQQLTNIENYRKEITRMIFHALEQLECTEKDLKIENPIKIILSYDNYIDSNILPHVFKDKECPVNDDGRYFLVNTDEMEMFLKLSMSNEKMFDKVAFDMLHRNKEYGFNLFQVMYKYGWKENSYIKSSIFNEYKMPLESIKDKHKKFKST